MKKAVDGSVAWIKPDGKPTQYFLELMQSISRNGLQDGVSTTAPTDGQVMVFLAATGLWTPGSN